MTTIKTISVKSFGRGVARSMLIIPAVYLFVCLFLWEYCWHLVLEKLNLS